MEADIEWLHSEWKSAEGNPNIDGSIQWYNLSLNYEILKTKVNLGKWEDSYECILMQAFKFCREAEVLS